MIAYITLNSVHKYKLYEYEFRELKNDFYLNNYY